MTKGRRKGNVLDGMHADMLIVSLLTALQSLIGIPWLVAATVRSLSHVGALTKLNDKGEIIGVSEQRVTGFSIHALIGCTILFSKPRQLLAQVPLPVLMGLFMYLGTTALPGNEMWERLVGLFKDKAVAPAERWTNKVPNRITNRHRHSDGLLGGHVLAQGESARCSLSSRHCHVGSAAFRSGATEYHSDGVHGDSGRRVNNKACRNVPHTCAGGRPRDDSEQYLGSTTNNGEV